MSQILYYNRYSRQVEAEAVYGEAWLRAAYGNPLGRLAVWGLARRAFLSRWYGRRMHRPKTRELIRPFIEAYGLDPAEFARELGDYRDFNEFFCRALKPEARPIHADPDALVFPADGRHLGFQDWSQCEGLFVKGQVFSLARLIGDESLAARYARGSVVLSRLCPVDYHRFHFVTEGIPTPARLIDGWLYSVSPIALAQNIHYFTQNKRQLTALKTTRFGTVLQIEVGATNVGSIRQTYVPGDRVQQGTEKGFFAFGGSSVVTIFEPGKVQLDEDLVAHSAARRELYAHMGDRLGVAK